MASPRADSRRWQLRTVGRGLCGRCPRCGSRGVFASFFELHPRCPACGYGFEREEGYWLGAMAVDIVVVEAVFGAVFVGGMLVTWPDVPWTALLVAGLVVNGVLPVLLYPLAKTTWTGLDLFFNPADPVEEADALAARDADRRQHDAGG